MFDPALLRLMRMLSVAGFRKIWKQVKSPAGALLAIGFLCVLSIGIGPMVVMAIVNPMFTDSIRDNPLFTCLLNLLPLMLYAMAAMTIVLDSGKTFLELKPPELQFVLAGPFTDRQILSYRLLTMTVGWVPMSMFFGILMLPYSGSFVGAWLGVMFGGAFLILLAIVYTLLRPRVPAFVLVGIRFMLLLGILLILADALRITLASESFSMIKLSEELGQSAVAGVLAMPFKPFVHLVYGEFDAVMLVNLVLSMVMVIVELAACYALNSGFSELAAEGVSRRIRKLERLKGGSLSTGQFSQSESKWSLPEFGWMGGAGPIAWQQVLVAARKTGRLLPVVLLLGMIGMVVAYYVRVAYPNVMSSSQKVSVIPVALGVASYIGFLVSFTAQAGFTASPRNLTWFQLLPTTPFVLGMSMVTGSLLTWFALRLALFLPAFVLTSFSILESLAFLFAGFALDVTFVSALNLVTAATNLRLVAQGPPDILQGARAVLFMFVVILAVQPTLLVSATVTFIVGVVVGFSLAGCALTAGLVALVVQPFFWWCSGTLFLRRELPAT